MGLDKFKSDSYTNVTPFVTLKKNIFNTLNVSSIALITGVKNDPLRPNRKLYDLILCPKEKYIQVENGVSKVIEKEIKLINVISLSSINITEMEVAYGVYALVMFTDRHFKQFRELHGKMLRDNLISLPQTQFVGSREDLADYKHDYNNAIIVGVL